MPNLHPLFVHLPLALLSASWLFDVVGILLRKEEFERTGWWTLLAGAAGLAATVVTGLAAESSVVVPERAGSALENHQQLAFAAAAIYSGVLLWRFARRTCLPQPLWMYFTLSGVGVLLLWLTGWFGGELVFRYGVGVLR
ncbi:MAG: hypothetical protein C4326_03200 [Ignavibacteria bacterium]